MPCAGQAIGGVELPRSGAVDARWFAFGDDRVGVVFLRHCRPKRHLGRALDRSIAQRAAPAAAGVPPRAGRRLGD